MLIDLRERSHLTAAEALTLLGSVAVWLIITENWRKDHPVQNEIKKLHNEIYDELVDGGQS